MNKTASALLLAAAGCVLAGVYLLAGVAVSLLVLGVLFGAAGVLSIDARDGR